MDAIVFLAGILLGIAAGLLPGIHPNSIASMLSTVPLDAGLLALLLIAMFPANIIASFIPAVFFGIPDESTFISALPGQRMTLQGKGLTAMKTILLSILVATAFSALLLYPSLFLFPFAYSLISPFLKYIVLGLSAILIIRSKNPLLALPVFLCAGLLGYFSLNSGIYDPFMPLFSGMFAVGSLLSITESRIPEQKKEEPFSKALLPYILLGVLFGMFADLLPGISSPAQVAVFMGLAVPMDSLAYLSSIGSISISQAAFSLSTEVSMDKSRVGTTAWLSEFTDIGQNLPLLTAFFLLSAAITAFLLYTARKKISAIATLNSRPIAIVLIVYLFAITALLDGFTGIAIFAVASALGWVTVRLGVERTQLMGA
ncbi:tripartite tricarboxylate transporter permease, partial [Candidatus Micrarchaeota archaeon]|nr:tripartite tricarboxylate transporter permease [Candidatus Micrarchaeota archaeon]